jgi:hypothetical protein
MGVGRIVGRGKPPGYPADFIRPAARRAALALCSSPPAVGRQATASVTAAPAAPAARAAERRRDGDGRWWRCCAGVRGQRPERELLLLRLVPPPRHTRPHPRRRRPGTRGGGRHPGQARPSCRRPAVPRSLPKASMASLRFGSATAQQQRWCCCTCPRAAGQLDDARTREEGPLR